MSQTIFVPETISNSLTISVENYGNDRMIVDTDTQRTKLIMDIVDKEMCLVRRQNPHVDWKKIQDMIRSSDPEMRNLGVTSLGVYTKYAHRLIDMTRHGHSVDYIIHEYYEKNGLNILDEIL